MTGLCNSSKSTMASIFSSGIAGWVLFGKNIVLGYCCCLLVMPLFPLFDTLNFFHISVFGTLTFL